MALSLDSGISHYLNDNRVLWLDRTEYVKATGVDARLVFDRLLNVTLRSLLWYTIGLLRASTPALVREYTSTFSRQPQKDPDTVIALE